MQVHFINVGYGDAILITINNFVILVDGGTNRTAEYLAPGCTRTEDYLNKLGYNKIDLLIISHLHDDHVSGLVNIVKHFQVKKIWINVKPEESTDIIAKRLLPVVSVESGMLFIKALDSYAKIFEECQRKNITIEQIGKSNGRIKPDDDIIIDVLAPSVSLQNEALELFHELHREKDIKKAEKLFYRLESLGNPTSLALRIKSGDVSVMLTGDKTQGWEELYTEYGSSLESQILKVAHHGQIDGMPQAMLDISKPQYVVICSSADRRYNSAHPSIISRAHEYLLQNGKKGGVYVTSSYRTLVLPPV